jgi:hypothetical protein
MKLERKKDAISPTDINLNALRSSVAFVIQTDNGIFGWGREFLKVYHFTVIILLL